MKFYGQWNPPVDKFLWERYFKNRKQGVFVECGAFDGVLESSCKFFEESMEWWGINFEPVPYIYDRLIKNRPKATNIKKALSNKNGITRFKQAVSPTIGQMFGNGSISHNDKHLKSLKQEGCKFEEFDVETVRFSDLIYTMNLGEIDLMVLDVEGHEIEVIEGMEGSAVIPKVFCVEYPHVGLEVLKKKLKPFGYVFDTTSFNNATFTTPNQESKH
jgi:FkbM family methyltransferase